MSVLSDIAIKKLCTVPSEHFDDVGYRQALSGPHSVPAFQFAADKYWADLKAQYCRPLTSVEQADWVGMIEPFVGESVRTIPNPKYEEVRNEFYAGWAQAHPGEAPPQHVIGEAIAYANSRYPSNIKVLSFGLSSAGYDVQLTDELQLFTNIHSTHIDPKRINTKCLVSAEIHQDEDGARFAWLPPNSYMLGKTVEYFRIPRDIMVVCVGKSTYARSGIHINVTPIEPGFEGVIVIEISNGTNLPAKIYIEEGIAQFLFMSMDQPCEVSYGDRSGKYQGQTSLQLPLV